MALEAGEDIQLLDVRAPFRLASGGQIDLGTPERFFNRAGSEVMALNDPAETGLDSAYPVVTICGHGNASRPVTAWLQQRGYSARSLAGGMSAWMDVLLPRTLEAPSGFDHLVQFDRVGKGALGYLLISNGEALVVDPPRDFGAYEFRVAELGARIVGVADTHVHADYISGAPVLAAKYGVPYYLHAGDSTYAFDGTPGKLNYTPVDEGSEIKVGNGVVRIAHTPGHTEGSVTLLAGDVALTGDFIFVSSVGRPDLADKTDEWSAQLFESLSRAKSKWPAETRIAPAHYSGNDERNADRSIWGHFRELRSSNEPLAIDDAAQFSSWVTARLVPAPLSYRRIKGINVGLIAVGDDEARELEGGKNECAVK